MKRHLIRAAVVLTVLLILAAIALPRLGSFLVLEDPLQPADAIVVLGGTMYERPLEAADLYNAHMAPRVSLSRQIADFGEVELESRGMKVMREIDIQIDVLGRLGVPREAITILDPADSTADEAGHVYQFASREHLKRIIIVTSKQHTRRSRLVMTRRLAPLGVQVIMRASKYDRADVEHWWRQRATVRFTLFETQRLLAYWIGIAD